MSPNISWEGRSTTYLLLPWQYIRAKFRNVTKDRAKNRGTAKRMQLSSIFSNIFLNLALLYPLMDTSFELQFFPSYISFFFLFSTLLLVHSFICRDLAWHDLAFYNADLYEGLRRMLQDVQEEKKSEEDFTNTYCCYFEVYNIQWNSILYSYYIWF